MIRCAMARNLNGVREESQLFPHLQQTLQKYREIFNGETVLDSMCLDGEVTDSDSQH